MKKKTFWTFLKRILIALIFIVIISIVGIFLIDQYKTAKSEFKNKYSDDYWSRLDDFKTYQELKAVEDKYYIYSPLYESPYEANDTIKEKISKARYAQELDLIISPLSAQSVSLGNRITALNKVYAGTKDEWIFEMMGVVFAGVTPQSSYDYCISKGYTGTKDEFDDLIFSDTKNAYLMIVTNGYVGTTISFINSLIRDAQLGENSLYQQDKTLNNYEGTLQEWIIKILKFNNYGPVVAYDFVVANGYTGSKDAWLSNLALRDGEIYNNLSNDGYLRYFGFDEYLEPRTSDYELFAALYNDTGKAELLSGYEAAKTKNTVVLQELAVEKDNVDTLIEYANSRNLVKWNDYFSRYQFVFENEGYEFYMNYALSTFKVVEKATGNVWYSNPQKIDSNALKDDQNTILKVYYGETAGALIGYSNYTYAVANKNSNDQEVEPNFSIKIDEENKTVQVWYHLEKRGIDYSYFPQYLSKTRAEEILARNKEKNALGLTDSNGDLIPNLTALKGDPTFSEEGNAAYGAWFDSYYQIVTLDNANNKRGYEYYEYKGNFKFMSGIQVRELHLWMYEWCDYTSSDLLADNEEFEVEYDSVNPSFEIAIEYKLTDKGLEVTVPGNSIREFDGYKLCNIDILPYFTSTPTGVEGYTIIPDGSGSVMLHDNGKANIYSSYSKRFYTTDLSQTSFVKKATSYDIMLPMYAVVNENNAGVLVEAIQMASQLELKATTSGFGNLGESNNVNYFKAYIRESQDVIIGTYSKDSVTKFTNELIKEDIIIDYSFIAPLLKSGENIDYSYVAKLYRKSLIERYNLSENDKTDSPVLDMNIIGAYSFKNNFLGIGYTAKDSMTTYNELSTIIDTFQKMGYKYVNAFYSGWRKESLVNTTFERIRLNSLLGSKAQLKALTNKENVTIYPYVSLGETNKFQESFGSNHYTARDVVGEIITKQPYDMSSNAYANGITTAVVSPRYYYAFAQSLVDTYTKLFGTNSTKKNAINLNSISIDKFGGVLSGDYKKGIEFFKLNAIDEQIKALDLIYDSGLTNINLFSPYDYAFKYTSHAQNIPYQSTQYEILDYSIPFYQLVVNGLFDYSGESINANIEKGIDYHLMKMIETGSNPQFTFTYDSSEKLLKTDYNMYYYTQYSKWNNEVQTVYDELSSIGIYGCELYAHNRIEPNIYKVTYFNEVDNKYINIILNYSLASITVNGDTIPAKSYKVVD